MTDFLLDAMLGKLATYLRMCGHDTIYLLDETGEDGDVTQLHGESDEDGDATPAHAESGKDGDAAPERREFGEDVPPAVLPPDESVIKRARAENRVLLTRDADLAAVAGEALLLETHDVVDQLQELADAGHSLSLPETPTRCGSCNGELSGVRPDTQTPAYAPDPVSVEVWQCGRCGQFFWKGSHWEDVAETLSKIE